MKTVSHSHISEEIGKTNKKEITHNSKQRKLVIVLKINRINKKMRGHFHLMEGIIILESVIKTTISVSVLLLLKK